MDRVQGHDDWKMTFCGRVHRRLKHECVMGWMHARGHVLGATFSLVVTHYCHLLCSQTGSTSVLHAPPPPPPYLACVCRKLVMEHSSEAKVAPHLSHRLSGKRSQESRHRVEAVRAGGTEWKETVNLVPGEGGGATGMPWHDSGRRYGCLR